MICICEPPAELQVSLFRIAIGPDAGKVIYAQPTPKEKDGNDLTRNVVSALMTMIYTFVLRQVNPTFKRHLLHRRTQKTGESIKTFVSELKTMIKVCEVHGSFTDKMN